MLWGTDLLSRLLVKLLLTLACCMNGALAAQSVVYLDSLPGKSAANGYFEYLEDPSRQMTLGHVLARDAVPAFAPTTGAVFNHGYSNAAIWLHARVGVQADAATTVTRYLEVDYSLLDDVVLYVIDDGKLVQSWHTGDTRPFHSRPIDHARFLFPLELQPGETRDVFLRVASTSSLRIPLTLWDPFTFYQEQRIDLLVDGLYFGILLLMLFYNLCLLISVRDISYFYYIAYTFGLCLFQFSMSGYGFEYAWSDWPALNDHLIPLSICLIAVFVLRFSQHVLSLATQWPLMHKIFTGLLLANALGVVAAVLLPYHAVIKPVVIDAIITAMVMLYAGVVESIKGSKPARWYILGWSSMFLGAVWLALASMGLAPANILTTNGFIFGSAIQVTLLSITLAERLNQINREKAAMELEAKRALQIANRTLQENNRIKDEFLATISHELRTPMNGVLGCLEHIHDEPISQKVEAYVNYADRSARHMMLLVDSLLTYTELQSGKLHLEDKPFAVRDLVNSARTLFTELSNRKGISLNFFIEASTPDIIIGDATRVSQMLNNLLDNAIKFTHHGRVEVRIYGEASSGNNNDFQLLMQVSDTGIGIAPEKLDLIFERFRQVDGAFNRGYGGLGIGLAVIKALLDQMHGSIDVDSREHLGCTFTIHIPCRYQTAEQTAEPAQETADIAKLPRAHSLHVLVVEDNPVNQMVLKGLLRKQGYEVSTVDNGAQAVEWLRHNAADAVLMDCQMPVMDGFTATRMIRQLPEPIANVPIIAVTANAMSQDKERCLNAGMDDYTVKPIDAKSLNKKIIYWVNTGHRNTRAGQG